MIRENKKATVDLSHTHIHGGFQSGHQAVVKCHMGMMCAGQWPLGLSTNRAGWKGR